MSDFAINSRTAGNQHQPSVARFLNSHFVVAWTHADGAEICASLLASDGQTIRDEFTVNDPGVAGLKRHHPVAATVPRGFVIAWLEETLAPPGPRPAVRLQRFDADGRKAGPPIQVSGSDVDTAHAPCVANLVDGGFVVTWLGTRADQRILARRFSMEGVARGDQFVVGAGDGFHVRPLVTSLANGNFAVLWTGDPVAPGGGQLVLRLFDLEGNALGAPIEHPVFGASAITLLDDGRIVAAHLRRGVDTDIGVTTNSVRAAVIGADGSLAGDPLFLSSERTIQCSSPSLAALPGGRFVACWLQKKADTFATTTHLTAAVFSIDQGTLGSELQIDAATAGERFQADVAALFGGDPGEAIFFAWDDSASSSDTHGLGVRGRAIGLTGAGGLVA
jgi:hypothetical protein